MAAVVLALLGMYWHLAALLTKNRQVMSTSVQSQVQGERSLKPMLPMNAKT